MAEHEVAVVPILSTSWRLIKMINDVLNRTEQTRQDARALKFLHRHAKSFLDTINEGLLGQDTALYSGTVSSLERLLTRILTACTDYIRMSNMSRVVNAAQTKRTILQLERQLQLFVNTYLTQSATHTDRIDLNAFSRPVTPMGTDLDLQLPDDVQWELMTHGDALTPSHGTQARVLSWSQDIANEPLQEPHNPRSIISQPGVIPPLRRSSTDDSDRRYSRESRTLENSPQAPVAVARAKVVGRPPSPEIPNWQSVKQCVESVLDDRNIPAFLGIFSLSKNFDFVLDVLENIYYSNPLNDMPGTRVGVLTVVAKFVSHLWLTNLQISKLSNAFTMGAPSRARYDDPVPWAADIFFESLQKLSQENEVTIEDPIVALNSNKNIRALAVELAQALAVLEDRLRRADPGGECVRWLARKYPRDFLSFPERVEMWVLHSVLQEGTPENVGLRYQLFYKIAKRSKEIHNFSAVRAIVSALQQLEQIHIETKIGTSELLSMARLDYQAGKDDVQIARRRKKPYLQPVQDILLEAPFSVKNVADTHHHIHWGNYLTLLESVDRFTSQIPLTSSQQYVFDGSRVLNFVKKSLINVELVDDVVVKVHDILRQYWGTQPTPGPLFQAGQAPPPPPSIIPNTQTQRSRSSETESTRAPLSLVSYQGSLPALKRDYR